MKLEDVFLPNVAAHYRAPTFNQELQMKEVEKKSFTKKAGDKMEHVGEKISNAGDKLEHSQEEKNKNMNQKKKK
jgi:hypothetical protein